MVDFSQLTDEEKEFYRNKAIEYFSDKELLSCTRDWSAWAFKTMNEDDFYDVVDDDSFIESLAEFIYNIVKVKVRKSKIKNILEC